MSIVIGYDFKKNEIIKKQELVGNKDEYEIFEYIIKKMENFNNSDFNIISNTNDYLTLEYKNYDICRIKYTDKSKWISIFISKKDRENNINNPLFNIQKNKNQLFWKSIIENENIDVYLPFINNICIQIK